MKKTLLAAALVAGFAGVAQAESSVTLYGLVDAGYGYQGSQAKFKGGNADQNGKVRTNDFKVHSGIANGSRWGLKGKEDLGNGTSAIFVLESGFDVGNGTQGQSDDDNDRLFGRQAYVGLTGESWGTFTLGRQYNAGDTFVAPIDPFGTGWGFAGAENVFGGSLSARYDSVIKYVSPNFSGFQFGIGLTHHENDVKRSGFGVNSTKTKETDAGVTTGLGYTSGPLYIGATFDYIYGRTKINGVKDRDEKTKAWNIGGTYDFDVVKVHLMYGGQKDGVIDGGPALAKYGVDAAVNATGAAEFNNGVANSGGFFGKGYKQHSWLAGLSAPVGDAGTVMFSYAGSTAKNSSDKFINQGKWTADSHNFALGYRHGLSKRTSVYGVASYGWSDLKAKNGAIDNGRKVSTKRTQAIVGLQHRF